MLHIIESLITFLRDETDLRAWVSDIYAGVAPEGAAYPLIVWNLITSQRGLAMGGARWDIPLIQFSVCSDDDSPQTVIGIADNLRTWMEDSEDRWTVDGSKIVRVGLESQNLLTDPDGGWMYQLDFSLDIEAR